MWTLQDAKNRFSAVVEAAQRGEPQVVTKRGKRAVVVVDAEQFDRLQAGKERNFVDFLLSAPKCDELAEILEQSEPLQLRDVDLDP